jgi:hypothetical protein
MKQFIIQQTVDINIQYIVEANDVDEAMEKYSNEPFDRNKILWIDVLDWDKAWDAVEYTGEVQELTPMPATDLAKWIEAGVLW